MVNGQDTQWEFFLVTLPGLEDLADSEVRRWFPDLTTTVETGGVTVLISLAQGLSMNLILKIPTRILLRVTRLNCRDFPKLFKTVKEYSWQNLLDPGCVMQVHASTHRSRLKIKKRIEKTCAEAWQAYQKTRSFRATTPAPQANLYV